MPYTGFQWLFVVGTYYHIWWCWCSLHLSAYVGRTDNFVTVQNIRNDDDGGGADDDDDGGDGDDDDDDDDDDVTASAWV